MAAHPKSVISKPLIILNFNANGLKNQLLEFTKFLQDNTVDIACVNETHLNRTDNIKIKNYKIYRTDRENKPGGGTAILIKKTISHNPIKISNLENVECTAITILLNHRETTIAAVYNQPTKPLLLSDLDKLIHTTKNFIILGDLNAKHQSWNSLTQNSRGKVLQIHSTQNNYAIVTPDIPTFYPHNARSAPDILDVALFHHTANILSVTTTADLNSDHNPVLLTIDSSEGHTLFTRSERITDWDLYKEILTNIPGNPTIQTKSDIDTAIQIYTYTIKDAFERVTHYKSYKQVQYKNIELESLLSRKRVLRRRWQKYKIRADKTALNKIQKEVKNLLTELRQDNFDEKLLLCESEPSKLWKISRALTGKRTRPENHALKNCDGTVVYSDQGKADIIARDLQSRFQTNSLAKCNDNFTRDVEFILQNYFSKRPESSPEIICPSEVRNIIKDLNPTKSPGPDHVHNQLLQNLPLPAVTHLTKIFNSCLRLNYFPYEWKKGVIIALPKPGKSPLYPENLRPITLLNTMSKILERIILKFISQQKCYIPNEQFGFREHHSTTHQLYRLCNHINSTIVSGQHTVCVFLDVEKAFDTVWPQGLLIKLITSDLPDTYVHIIKSFLTERTFKVKINNTFSSEKTINAGVPQGAVLSPTLFNIYTADFPRHKNCRFAQYADDTVIFTSDMDIHIAYNNLQDYLNKIENWLINWKIKINASKSSVVIFTKRRPQEPFELKLFDVVIPNQKETTYLGILLDHRLSFKPHMNKIAAKGYAMFQRLYPLFKSPSLSLWTKKTFYITIIRASLLYAYPAWSSVNGSLLRRLRGVQRTVLRTIAGADYTTSNKFLHEVLDIASIEEFSENLKFKFIQTLKNHPNPLLQKFNHQT